MFEVPTSPLLRSCFLNAMQSVQMLQVVCFAWTSGFPANSECLYVYGNFTILFFKKHLAMLLAGIIQCADRAYSLSGVIIICRN